MVAHTGKSVVPFAERALAVAESRGGHLAIRHGSLRFSYDDLLRRVLRISGQLQSEGLEQGDRVLLVSGEKLSFLLCHLAVVFAGGVSLPLNPGFTPEELAYFLADSGARVAIASGESAGVLIGLSPSTGSGSLRVLDPTELTSRAGAPYHAPTFGVGSDAMMLYTSGTTGRPKGAVHTHGTLVAAVQALASCWCFTADDALLNCLPLYHIHGLSFACHVALLSGCELILTDRFHPRRTLEEIGEATVFYGIPPFYYSFLKQSAFRERAARWDRLRLVTCGSAPIRAEVLPELEGILGRPLVNRYGMTETHVITSLPLTGPFKQGSVGLPVPGIELAVRDEGGCELEAGEVGQVWVRSPNLFDRYWQRPESTREAFDREGWFATGDLGARDADHFLTLRGRQKDLIIVNGYNVYPPVVERVLNECEGVRESAVIGVPDDRKGERVVAVVVREQVRVERATVMAFCRERLIDYQCPSRVVFVEALPRNSMGKVLKRSLRQSLTAGGKV